jgi:hypothetical protein
MEAMENAYKLLGFLFTTASRLIVEPTQSHIQCLQGTVSPGVKRPGHEADH